MPPLIVGFKWAGGCEWVGTWKKERKREGLVDTAALRLPRFARLVTSEYDLICSVMMMEDPLGC